MADEENIRFIECCDDRFEIIKRAREHIIDATNIECRPEEMQVLDNFLFRCWQMGWLKNDFHQLEKENAELESQIENLEKKNSELKNVVKLLITTLNDTTWDEGHPGYSNGEPHYSCPDCSCSDCYRVSCKYNKSELFKKLYKELPELYEK